MAKTTKVEVRVNDEVVWAYDYRRPVDASQNWHWGYAPRKMTLAVAAALHRAGRAALSSPETPE